MVDIKSLLAELRKLVTDLSEDMLKRVGENKEINAGLQDAFKQIEKGGRTAQVYDVWLEDYLDQVAVAWVLSCVFVRFMEDNELIDECYLAGERERRTKADNEHEIYFREHPHDSDREYLEYVFRTIGKIPACADLFAEGKTPLWAVGPSGDAAMRLLKFWRGVDTEKGTLSRSFKTADGGSLDTRFLGDLYQDLSERARKKYALLQTPEFIEEFILDRTLNPAIDDFGLETVRLIDPTCGSGHFLLGAFGRLFELWAKRDDNHEVAAQKAFDGVWGVDINPFAVAIARFRLIVAAVKACGKQRLKDAPGWKIHLATGDSLLFGRRWDKDGEQRAEQLFLATEEEGSWAPEIYACEDQQAVTEVLSQQYHAVVGNPPYITVKDKSLNAAYRDRYSTCHRQYSLGVPFTQRFFDLAIPTEQGRTGYVGMITANSFMKREFGKKLIQEFFPKIDLTHVIDMSGAYIPGHGTPTVILFGRNRGPIGDSVRAVLGIKGEPSTPVDPAYGLVWQSVISQIDTADAEDDFTSTADIPRIEFAKHPWSLSGGGAVVLANMIESNATSALLDSIKEIGFGAVTRADELFIVGAEVARRVGVPPEHVIELVTGDDVRDWTIKEPSFALFPYLRPNYEAFGDESLERFLWPWRPQLQARSAYGNTQIQRGLKWFEYSMLFHNRLRIPYSLSFACVATHNHVVFDRGGKAFNRHAPIIKLKDDATEEDHLALVGLLNSSTACFWMKQVFFPKGGDHVGQEGARVRRTWWDERYEFAGTQMQKMPIAKEKPLALAQQLDELAQECSRLLPDAIVAVDTPTSKSLAAAEDKSIAIRQQMIALQEELDWQCYELYGLVEVEKQSLFAEDLFRVFSGFRGLRPGQRAFEIVMARKMAAGQLETTWFDRHGSTPITELPSDWPDEYRAMVERRIEVIDNCKSIRLIEKPEFKRRWNTESWHDQQQRALRGWLLDRLETAKYTQTNDGIELFSVAQLSDLAAGDSEFMQVAAIYQGRDDFELVSLLTELVASESVPLLPELRYKAPGLRKRQQWEETWLLQRREDAGEDVGDIPVPPKYKTSDFLKTDYWRLRGKLDVPKERWVSFPHAETEADSSPVVGWAGWSHVQQATAIVAYYDARKRDGWTAERLTPLLACLDQLLPWIHQWHPEVDPEYNETPGTSLQTLLESEAQELALTLDDIRNWVPPKKKTTKRKKAKS